MEWILPSETWLYFSWTRGSVLLDWWIFFTGINKRIDNNKNYEPDNCTWITLKEQQKNRRCNHYIDYNGIRDTITGWAKRIGINPGTLLSRFARGMSVEKALTMTVEEGIRCGRDNLKIRFIEYNGMTKSLSQWAKYLGINICTLFDRLRRGWSIERAFTQKVGK
jgi:hypothetical protein